MTARRSAAPILLAVRLAGWLSFLVFTVWLFRLSFPPVAARYSQVGHFYDSADDLYRSVASAVLQQSALASPPTPLGGTQGLILFGVLTGAAFLMAWAVDRCTR